LDKGGKIKIPGGRKLKSSYDYHSLRSQLSTEELRLALDSITDKFLFMGLKLVVTKKRLCFRKYFNDFVIEISKKSMKLYFKDITFWSKPHYKITSDESAKQLINKLSLIKV
jgi:hypothetical protein